MVFNSILRMGFHTIAGSAHHHHAGTLRSLLEKASAKWLL
jgi:hypothetical protein